MAPRDVHPVSNFVDGREVADPQWYSHAVSLEGNGRLILTSGQVGQRKDGSWPKTSGEQIKQALSNLADVLWAAGASSRDIAQLRFYVVDWDLKNGMELVEPVIALLTETYGTTYRPLTTLIPVPKLAFPEAKFEIEAVASVGGLARPWNASDGHLRLPSAVATAHPVPPVEVDVVIVGGGFSGLTAAYDAHQAGLKTVLLEAKHRVGDRSRSQALKSGPGFVEMGATWINKTTQPSIYALTRKFGLETSEQYTTGDVVFQDHNGKFDDPQSAQNLFKMVVDIETTTASMDIHRWEDFPEDQDVSFAEWLAQKDLWHDPAIKSFSSFLTAAVVGREPDEVGAHYFLDYIKSGGGYISLTTEGEMGAQSLKVKNGTSAIAMALASSMPPGSVMIHSPVESITQSGNVVEVTTSAGSRYKAKKVIMTIPTNTYSEIKFSPPLPPANRALVSRTKPGVYAKMLLTYKAPWWRDAGLVGKFTSLVGPICFSWDVCDASLEQYSLALFVAGNIAARWHSLNELEREEAIIEHLAKLVGPKLADKARDILEVNCVEWTKEEYIGGAPTSAIGPKLLSKYGYAMRQPFGHVHFGGGEMAHEWKGYLEGAVTSGQRAAREVTSLLVGTAPS
ncbi:putative mao-A [Thozetella sp. PMI_491]|nr:putative mao-A [Thozetella sp. PMI_491]